MAGSMQSGQSADDLVQSTENAFKDVGHEPFYAEPELWVAVAFILFVGLILFYKLPAMLTKALDKRAEDIAAQLEEAHKLREEAQSLVAQYQRKQRDAEAEARDIVIHAEAEAKRAARDAEAALAASIERREQLARDKIAQAEASAVKDVQTAAVDVATAVARRLIAEGLAPEKANELVEDSIKDLPKLLH